MLQHTSIRPGLWLLQSFRVGVRVEAGAEQPSQPPCVAGPPPSDHNMKGEAGCWKRQTPDHIYIEKLKCRKTLKVKVSRPWLHGLSGSSSWQYIQAALSSREIGSDPGSCQAGLLQTVYGTTDGIYYMASSMWHAVYNTWYVNLVRILQIMVSGIPFVLGLEARMYFRDARCLFSLFGP